MAEWIGIDRRARRCYGFDEIALVPGLQTINPNEVDTRVNIVEVGMNGINSDIIFNSSDHRFLYIIFPV